MKTKTIGLIITAFVRLLSFTPEAFARGLRTDQTE